MAVTRLKDVVENGYEAGQNTYTTFRKVAAITSVVGTWADYSMAPGNPRPNYYTGDPLTAKALDYRFGLWHGGSVSPATKYLHKFQIAGFHANMVACTFLLCDYLMFYPLVDMDSGDEQTFDNTVTLPRYSDGIGVRAFLVATNPYIGGAQFVLNYTNQNGEAGRIAPPAVSNQTAFIASLVNSGNAITRNSFDHGPFISLAPGDTGVRSVESIQFLGPNGGLAALVLVKPLVTFTTGELNAACEIDFLKDKGGILPVIKDGAYLNFLILPLSNIATQPIQGEMHTIWS